MAIIANTILTYSQVGIREDLKDAIYMISPTETPMLAAFGKETAYQTLVEWQTDSLAAAAANAQLQGDDVSFSAPAYTTRIGNKTQISRKDVITSGTADAVKKAGRTSEKAWQLKKHAAELRRDQEFVLGSNQAPVTGNSTTAQQLRPVLSWYSTNSSIANGLLGTGGVNGTSTTARTDGTQRAFTETMLQTAMQQAWLSGGMPNLALAGPKQRVVMSAFTGFGSGGATKFDKTEDMKVYGTVGVYVSDFGEIAFKPSRFVRGAATTADREVHVLTTDLWAIAELRSPTTVDLAKTGDAEKAIILTEWTLMAKNESGSTIIADLT